MLKYPTLKVTGTDFLPIPGTKKKLMSLSDFLMYASKYWYKLIE
jgi:hypothetical protein